MASTGCAMQFLHLRLFSLPRSISCTVAGLPSSPFGAGRPRYISLLNTPVESAQNWVLEQNCQNGYVNSQAQYKHIHVCKIKQLTRAGGIPPLLSECNCRKQNLGQGLGLNSSTHSVPPHSIKTYELVRGRLMLFGATAPFSLLCLQP